jgi:hypothetical protein
LQFLIKNFFLSAVIFFQFLVIKALDPDWIRIRIGNQPKMLNPDPDEMNADPQPCPKGPPAYLNTILKERMDDGEPVQASVFRNLLNLGQGLVAGNHAPSVLHP